jgi:hypothetical protein
MPAVQLAQLRLQINKLIWYYTQPPEFIKNLHELLEHYSNRGVYRPGKTIQPVRQINTYYTSALILREIEKELSRQVKENPMAAISLADALWQEDFLELHSLSAFLLGLLPINFSNQVIDRLQQWAVPPQQSNTASISSLLELGTIRLRREKPELYINLIQEWISSSNINQNKIGIEALISLVKDKEFLDIPKIFLIITPLVKHVPQGLQGELRIMLSTLIERTASETGYFLNQIVLLSPNQGTKRLLRRVMGELPDYLRNQLRKVVNDPDFSI